MKKTDSWSKEEVHGWLLEKIKKTAIDPITVTNFAEKSIADTGLDSVALIELVADFETKFDCRVVTEQLLEKESLSEVGEFLYQAAVATSA